MPSYGSGPYGAGPFGRGAGGGVVPPPPIVAPLPALGTTAQRMQGWLPEMWYARMRSVAAMLQAEGAGLDQLELDITAVRNARLPETAETWGLTRFETETTLGVRPDLSVLSRQQRVIGRFRGVGSTIARLQTIALAWGFGGISIIPDPEAYTLYVQFYDTRGQPADIQSHQAEMRANVQAHLGLTYSFRYLTWQELLDSGSSWQNLNNQGLTWTQLTVWVPALIQRAAHPVTVSLA